MICLNAILLLIVAFATYVRPDPPEIVIITDGVSGDGVTSRYWDCCKAGCSWKENLSGSNATTPVRSCTADGDTTQDVETQSGCTNEGDVAYVCSDQQPWAYNDTVSFGWVAASFTGDEDYHECCACVVLEFKGDLAGKKLIAQVTSTGSSLSENQFSIAMPGGWGGPPDGCAQQWNVTSGAWGDPTSGVSSKDECANLPTELQPGCEWRFDWFEGASNPEVSFYQIECPQELLEISGCQ